MKLSLSLLLLLPLFANAMLRGSGEELEEDNLVRVL
jgi:hypothetical protein